MLIDHVVEPAERNNNMLCTDYPLSQLYINYYIQSTVQELLSRFSQLVAERLSVSTRSVSVCLYICPLRFCTHARIEGPGVVACTCLKAEAGGWMLAEPRLLSRARLREARRRRTRRSASMQRVTKQQRQARRRR